ncbi:MAG TPA: hypothetical protein VFU32_04200 [Ktedonobacterales bacterium]|nr:hypothetical protein [Ktedonobacterales bacterium]
MLDLLFLLALVVVGVPVFGLVIYGIIYGGALLEWLLIWLVYEEKGPVPEPNPWHWFNEPDTTD